MEKFYDPSDDTFMIYKVLKEELKKPKNTNLNICEIGVGSGYTISKLANEFKSNTYFGSDINPYAINETKRRFNEINSNIILNNKSFFSGFNKNKKFDIIYFNTPYLPMEENDNWEDLKLIDKAIYGGKKGYEVIEEFLKNIYNNLSISGSCYILFSSLSDQKHIENILSNLCFEFKEIKRENHFFEELIIFKIKLSTILKELKKKKVKNLKYLASGKHSKVLEGKIKNLEIIIKIGLPQHIEKEIFFLKKLENEEFSTKINFYKNNFVVKKKITGDLILEFFKKVKLKNDLILVLNNILTVCYRLDELLITKFEMTNPHKHIFVQKDLSIKMIDFERSIFSESPKNTRQVLEFFRRKKKDFERLNLFLDENKIFEISKKYKKKNI